MSSMSSGRAQSVRPYDLHSEFYDILSKITAPPFHRQSMQYLEALKEMNVGGFILTDDSKEYKMLFRIKRKLNSFTPLPIIPQKRFLLKARRNPTAGRKRAMIELTQDEEKDDVKAVRRSHSPSMENTCMNSDELITHTTNFETAKKEPTVTCASSDSSCHRQHHHHHHHQQHNNLQRRPKSSQPLDHPMSLQDSSAQHSDKPKNSHALPAKSHCPETTVVSVSLYHALLSSPSKVHSQSKFHTSPSSSLSNKSSDRTLTSTLQRNSQQIRHPSDSLHRTQVHSILHSTSTTAVNVPESNNVDLMSISSSVSENKFNSSGSGSRKNNRVMIKNKHLKSTSGTATKTLKITQSPPSSSINLCVSHLPAGWTFKTFQRSAGKSKGRTYKFFYSPLEKVAFRSLKGAQTFANILNESVINGNELEARKLYLMRGNKF